MAPPTTNDEKKKKVSSNSSHIPDDISFIILSKLPIKSLKRFSCVRKSWSLLFQNPDFINMFRNNFISKSHPLYDDACQIVTQFDKYSYNWNIYLLSGDKFENKLKLDFPPSSFHNNPQCSFRPFTVLGSAINGILCIFHKNDTLLWNPATDQIKVIPPGFAELKHDLTTFTNRYGFGYDHVTHDYKLIQHVGYALTTTKLNPFWEIYSLKSNSWRKIDFDMPTMSWLSNNGLYFDGVCHWLALSNKLVSFNLCNEMCFITPSFLEDSPDDFDVINLNVLNGFVAMITSRINSTSFQISILGEFGVKESWIKLFDVERMSCTIYPIRIGLKGNIFFKTKDDELVYLDLTTGLIKEIGLKGNKFSCQVVLYKRNLHPIGEINN